MQLALDRTHPDDRVYLRQVIERVTLERRSFSAEHRLQMPNGLIKHVRVVARRAASEDPERVLFIGAVTDITERKRAEQQRERLRQLEGDLAHINRVSTLGELAATLGIRPHGVKGLVRRHGLPATGNGKARRFPRETAEALRDRLSRGASVQTANFYLQAVKQFARWLVKDRRTGDNPLAHLQGGNVKTDRRHDRRELTEEELRSLLNATRASGRAPNSGS